MRRALRWLLRVVLAALAIVLVGFAVIAILVHTSWGREKMRAAAEDALSANFPGSHVGKLEGSVFGTLVLRDVAIAGGDGKPIVAIGEVDLEIGLLPLFAKRVRIDRLAVDDVTIVPHAPAKKPEPEPQPGEETAKGSSWSIALDDVEVRHAQIVMPDGKIELAHLELDATLDAPAGQPMIALVRARGNWRERPASVIALASIGNDELLVPYAAAVVTGDDTASALVLGARVADNGDTDGIAVAHVPAATVQELAGIPAADDLEAEVRASGGDVDAHAELGVASVRALVHVDVAARSARGLVIGQVTDATAVAALEADRDHVRGLVSARALRGTHHALALVAIDASRTGAWTIAELASDFGAARAEVVAQLARKGDTFELTKASLVGRASELAAIAGDTPIFAKRIDVRLTAKGTVWPDPDVRGDGDVSGEELAAGSFGAARLHVRLDAVRGKRAGTSGRVHVDLGGATSDGTPLATAMLDARTKIAPDGAIDADIDAHRVETATAAVWTGTTGHLAIRTDAITLADLHTSNGAGQIAASGRFDRGTKDIAAHVAATNVPVAAFAPGVAGTLAGDAKLARRSGVWDATGQLTGTGIVAVAEHPAFDASSTFALHGRRLAASATATSPAIGALTVSTELDGPAAVTDVAAWKRLERRAIRSAKLVVSNVQLAGADPALSGTLDGTVELTALDVTGELHVRGVHTRVGDVEGDLTFAPGEHADVAAGLAARLAGIATAGGSAELALPAHPLDGAAWRTLGRGAIAGANVHAKQLAFDPDLLARLGSAQPVRGWLDVSVDVAPAASSVTAKLAVHDLVGGALVRPVELALDATSDMHDTHVTASAHSGSLALVAIDARVLVPIDQLREASRHGVALAGTITVPEVAARELLAIFGRDDVGGGKVSGNVELGGTLDTPTAHATIDARDVAIRASVEGRAPAVLSDLALDARWTGTSGSLDVQAHEPAGGLLQLTGHGRPDHPDTLMATLDAKSFDIAPLAAFAPGQIGAARGVLDGSLALEGFDPATGKLHGKLHVQKGRLPLHDLIGTLRNADLAVDIADHTVHAKLAGKLGRGDITGGATVALTGSTPRTAKISLGLRKISLIRAHQPVIDADVTAQLEHSDRWTGEIQVQHAHVLVPATGGVQLLEAAAPGDMVFVDAPPPKAAPLLHRPPPVHPWLVARLTLGLATLDMEEDEVQAKGNASGHLVLSLGGDSIGLDGDIEAQRGDIELLGQRSQLDHGRLTFDGTLDPLLDIRVTRDLDTITVMADVAGRASKPEVTFSSDSGSYSQGDLLAYFVGGQPGGDRSEVGQAAAAASAGYASSLISKRLNKLLPVTLDFRYETSTSVNSEALGVGRWLNSDTYVEGRTHVEARPDENVSEGVLEYHLPGNWMLRGIIGGQGYDSGEIERRWHW